MRPILILAACAGLASCGPPPAGTPTPVASACDAADGSRVRLEGYLRYQRGLLSFCHATNGQTTDCDLAIYADPAKPADFNVMAPPPPGPEPVNTRLTLRIGSSPGQMDDIPDRFTASDIKVHLEGGGTATDGSGVIVDGKLHIVPASPDGASPKSCWVDVDWAKPKP